MKVFGSYISGWGFKGKWVTRLGILGLQPNGLPFSLQNKPVPACIKVTLLLILTIGSVGANAQNSMGVGTETPNPNAVLHLVSPTGAQGFLVPTYTTTERTATSFTSNLSVSDNGLLVFDTDEGVFYFWMDTDWSPVGSASGDMLLSVFDTNLNNYVDTAEVANTLNGFTVETSVPVGAVFTDDQTATEVSVSPSGNLVSSDVQSALLELQADIDAGSTGGDMLQSVYDTDANNVVDAADSLSTSFIDGLTIAYNAVSGVLEVRNNGISNAKISNLDWTKLTNVPGTIADGDNQTAAEVSVTPTGNLAASDAQAALVELQTDIDASNANIANNTTAISTNQTDISNNATNIGTNTSDIATLNTSVSSNSTAITMNQSDIANNATNIGANTTNISTNTSSISTNTTNISTNTSNITANSSTIGSNTTSISNLSVKTQSDSSYLDTRISSWDLQSAYDVSPSIVTTTGNNFSITGDAGITLSTNASAVGISAAAGSAQFTLNASNISVNASGAVVANSFNGNGSALTNVNAASIDANAVSTTEILDGTISGADLDKANIAISGFGPALVNVSFGGNKITNLATPTLTSDAANKNYVDTQVGGIISSQWINNGSDIYYSAGLVGINNNSPVEALDVIGNVRVSGDMIYATPITKIYAVTPMDFQVIKTIGTEDYVTTHNGGIEVGAYSGTAGTNVTIAAPVHLPNNAVVTQIDVIGRNTSGNPANFNFVEKSYSTASTPNLITSIPPGTSGVNSFSGTGLSIPIDNNLYNYLITFQAWTSQASLTGVKIYYQVSSPD